MADKDRFDIEDTGSPTAGGAGVATEDSAEADARREARRRVLLGGLATTPLIMTLASRPALAGGGGHWGGGKNCGPSTLMSGNTSSNHEPDGCRGKTPGYWKTHADKAGDCFCVGPCNPISNDKWGTCDDYSVPTEFELTQFLEKLRRKRQKDWNKIKEVENYLALRRAHPNLDDPPFGTCFSKVFGPGCTEDSATTMMQALWLDDTPPLPPDGSGGSSPVLAHCVAAYCNAQYFGKNTFGLSPGEVIELVVSMIATRPFELKDLLEAMNERG